MRRSVVGPALVLLVGAVLAPAARAQEAGRAFPYDTAALAAGPHARACALLERTIFNVDVLTVRMRFGPETAGRVERLAQGDGAHGDSVAVLAIHSRDAFMLVEFLRDVGFERFLNEVRDDVRDVAEAGFIARATYDEIASGLPRWYGFLQERGVREGDRILYRVRGDTLHSGYRAADGELLLHQVDVGAERRRSVLGGYFVRGSSLRDELVRSLLDPAYAGC